MGAHQKLRAAARAALALIGLALLCAIAALSACATEFVPGPRVPAPPGWVDFCRRNPADVDC